MRNIKFKIWDKANKNMIEWMDGWFKFGGQESFSEKCPLT